MIVKTFSKGIMYIVLLVGAFGLFSGLAIADTDIVNPRTSQAEAEQMKMMTEYTAEVNTIDLHYYRQERQLQALAEEAKINADVTYHQRYNENKLLFQERAGLAFIITASALAYSAVVMGLLFLWYRFHKMIKLKESALRTRSPEQFTQAYLRRQPTSSRNGSHRAPLPNEMPSGKSRIRA